MSRKKGFYRLGRSLFVMGAIMGFHTLEGSISFSRDLESLSFSEERSKLKDKISQEIRRQERILGIRHFGMPNFSIDTIRPSSVRDSTHGSYNSRENRIWVDVVKYDSAILSHELGHFYADKLSENIGNGNWPPPRNFLGLRRNTKKGIRLISEGVAQYFRIKTIGHKKNPRLEYRNFKDYFKGDGNKPYYNAGFGLVAPILDIDINRGIELLIKNPPKEKELEDLISYRARILEMMNGN